MTGRQMRVGREGKGWTQKRAALKLGVSQPYLSLLERDERRVPEGLARKAASTYSLSATTLPLEELEDRAQPKKERVLTSELAALGYPGFSYLKSNKKRNPAEVLLSALCVKNLESRVTEALPWLLLEYPDLEWEWLVKEAKVHDLQNRLGFLVNVARRVAEKLQRNNLAVALREKELLLERSRLVWEDTLCRESLSQAEKRWLEAHRPEDAKHWGLLTDLSPEHLKYAS